ncbi:uncharacterized protein LOC115957952 isoform X2 [Quercus lobata]|uniref:uncharacterized protein LOC115957952 isoform X2 n=1 Tax=Quercus lobata TaxID=97700 RepID=UPI001247813A|nr:uncharacterized protein LOC115957952 isoform X2 [Quercus lobata]
MLATMAFFSSHYSGFLCFLLLSSLAMPELLLPLTPIAIGGASHRRHNHWWPRISKALAGADRKDLLRKLPKFICDEEKALERTRKILTEKIAQLNSVINDVSAQLHGDDVSNGTVVNTDEVGASM